MIRLTAILLSLMLLQGCAGLIVAGVVGGAVMLNDERPLKTQLGDTDADFTISAALAKHEDIKNHTHIRAITVNRKVLVIGQAPNERLKVKVIQIINELKLSDKIYDQIRIGSPTNFGTRSNDTWITTKVKGRMLNTDGLDITRIKVVTENSEVFLLGIIDKNQADIAADIARFTTGVKRVIKVFESPKK
ncbi:BON domain-containing protein [Parashewanella spongiae]|uniref:BON domain-containing protein n=1 Tax=Parashewanella spongiae TaxID=342950 RepID=A0A3A6U8M0_9GAMM|nr:BON domain-containing protein [Parashewanella spongiae]MCL1078601.1 BON domain-containing protein [Parashewanella spongiae]RJY13099.1 BON domain-containing protein [Parashewanella spongiae]